jgi:protein O-mannosyl-transferase
VCALLGAATLGVFWPALHCGFVNYDDPGYVTLNANVQHGLNWGSLQWALTTGYASNWHPLTWVSHIIDCRLYGLEPAGHHLTSLVLHLASSILLFLVLNRMTSALWPSAFVAAMFALHPLRVESVVWVAERKDVLSAFFWMLTIGAYARFTEEVKIGGSRSKFFYVLSLVFFAFGLMSKPMLVTLPFVLLLLDFWPLGRLEFGESFSWRLIGEKIPFLLLAAGDSVVTFFAQKQSGVVEPLTAFPWSTRLANIPVAYARYVSKNFWPSGLAASYPHRPLGLLEVGGAVCLLAVISILALRRRTTQPYLAVGWFWFLGVLVPTIGLVQVGLQSMADRYSYLPSIGLWIMVAWGARDWIGDHVIRRNVATVAGGLAIAACIVMTPMQIQYWQNTGTLLARRASVSDPSYAVYYDLGCYTMGQGNYSEAIVDFKKAIEAPPDPTPLTNHAIAFNNLGFAYLHEGQISNAVANLEQALALQPRYPEAYYNLGGAFLANGQPDVAIDCLQRALAQDSTVAETHYRIANALVKLGRHGEAIAQYSQALALRPGMDEAVNNLALLLATCPDRSLRDGPRAIALAAQASQRAHDQNPEILGTLAAAYAETGKFADAAATAQRAHQLALAQNNRALAGVLEGQYRAYQTGNRGSQP